MTNETKFLIGSVIVTVVALVGGVIYFTSIPQTAVGEVLKVEDTLRADSHKIGPSDAKVKISEYSDFQCPACAAAAPIVTEMLKKYEGKVYFEYNHFPLTIHRWSQDSAEAAEAAGAQGKFFEYGDLLFSRQKDWEASADPIPKFKEYAKELKLDEQRFADDLSSHKYRSIVIASLKQGEKLDVKATPTFFVNGKKIEGGLRLDEWTNELEPLFAKK